MKKLLLAGVAAAGLTLAAGGAQAAPSIGSTPAHNDVFGVAEGWFGANLYLIAGGEVDATLTFLGSEAAFANTFNINGGAVEYTNAGGGPILVTLTPGLLNFTFTTDGGAGSVANGANDNTTTPNFFLSFGDPLDVTVNGITPGSGFTVLIALDDGGAGPDDNHDDLVVRLTILARDGGDPGTFSTTVPEPASLALLGMGLLGLGFVARRRRG